MRLTNQDESRSGRCFTFLSFSFFLSFFLSFFCFGSFVLEMRGAGFGLVTEFCIDRVGWWGLPGFYWVSRGRYSSPLMDNRVELVFDSCLLSFLCVCVCVWLVTEFCVDRVWSDLMRFTEFLLGFYWIGFRWMLVVFFIDYLKRKMTSEFRDRLSIGFFEDLRVSSRKKNKRRRQQFPALSLSLSLSLSSSILFRSEMGNKKQWPFRRVDEARPFR